MKPLCLILILTAQCLAIPKINPYVASSEDRLSDIGTHPHKPTREYSNEMAGFEFNEEEYNGTYWMKNAMDYVQEKIKIEPNTNKARNVIMFLGDGMSHYSLAAARLLLGGEHAKLSFETFPYTASSMTYCVDKQVADSACTATAYLCGVKNNDAMIGLNANAKLANCFDQQDPKNHVDSIATWFQRQGRSTGVVTTTRITHATPAGTYAHIAERDWEDDSKVLADGCSSEDNDDIAEQLVYGDTAKKFKVIFGGGARHFYDRSIMTHNQAGRRVDGKNLVYEWLRMDPTRKFIDDRKKLMDVKPEEVDQILGLFNHDHINYWIDIERDQRQEVMPSLTDMTTKAIDILNKDEKGYFLLVEGGRIDHGHHGTESRHAITEAVEFSKAIQATLDKVNINETLIVVTADHGHVMTMSGYAKRGNDIFGMAGVGTDKKPYMTLSYANGEGYLTHVNNGERVDPSTLDTKPNNFMFPASVPLDSETHGGEDVGVWAIGPWAHLFQGTIEQHVIPHIMAYASCVGSGLRACDNQ